MVGFSVRSLKEINIQTGSRLPIWVEMSLCHFNYKDESMPYNLFIWKFIFVVYIVVIKSFDRSIFLKNLYVMKSIMSGTLLRHGCEDTFCYKWQQGREYVLTVLREYMWAAIHVIGKCWCKHGDLVQFSDENVQNSLNINVQTLIEILTWIKII